MSIEEAGRLTRIERNATSAKIERPSFRLKPNGVEVFPIPSFNPSSSHTSETVQRTEDVQFATAQPVQELSDAPSFEVIRQELSQRIKTIYRRAVDRLFSEIAPSGQQELIRLLSQKTSSLAARESLLGLAALQDVEKKPLSGKMQSRDELSRAFVACAKSLEQAFDQEIVSYFLNPNLPDAIGTLDALLNFNTHGANLESSTWKRLNNRIRKAIASKNERAKIYPIPKQELLELPTSHETAAHITEQAQSGLIKSENKAEDWIDQEREVAFAELKNFFHTTITGPEGIDGIHQWFVDCFNPAIVYEERKPLRREDVSSLRIVEASSASANAVAGTVLQRPILVFTDIEQLRRFYQTLTGVTSETVGGFVIAPENFGEGYLSKTGLILSSNIDRAVSHELRHTVDPLVHKREDDILDEAFAYFSDHFPTKDALTDGFVWERYALSIIASCQGNAAAGKHSVTDFEERVFEFIGVFKDYAQGKELVDIQRFILRCKSMEEARVKMALDTTL